MHRMPVIEWNSLSHDLIDELFSAELEELHLADRYEVHRILGQGGQGTVYLAKDEHLGREVAIKCASDQTVKGETNLLSTLSHPGIPQIYDCGVAIDGTHYLVMQFIPGQRLDNYLQQQQPDLQHRIDLFRDIASAVRHAHEQGILHRDLKPSNILVSEKGKASIIDWGLAATGDPRAVCGSPHFAAPEQLDGQLADQRADIFALGVLLYYIISGELPYARRVTDFNEFRAVRAGLRRVPLVRVAPHAPRYLDTISQRAMAPQAGARFQSVDVMMQELNKHNLELFRSQRSTMGRLRMPMLMATLTVVCFVAGLYLRPYFDRQDLTTTPEELERLRSDRLEEPFVGPPSPDSINWDSVGGQGAVTEDKEGISEGEPANSEAEKRGNMNPEALPSLEEVLGQPQTFDETEEHK